MEISNINIDKYYNTEGVYHKVWNSLEKKNNLPNYLNNIKIIDYLEFEEKVLSGNEDFANELVKSLLDGDVYLLKNAFSEEYMLDLRKKASVLFKNSKSSFHKIIENCPNFYRNITSEHSQKYAFHQIKHTHYFYPWNEDFFNLYRETNKRWRILKLLSGYYNNVWENNTPKDGIVDRIQIVKYPPGSGELELHQDPYIYQKFFISIYLSERDKDYFGGGMYLINKKNEKIELEKNINIGDLSFGLGTILHGVEKTAKNNKDISETDTSGRWFIGLYSTVSDYVKDRHTGRPASQSLNKDN